LATRERGRVTRTPQPKLDLQQRTNPLSIRFPRCARQLRSVSMTLSLTQKLPASPTHTHLRTHTYTCTLFALPVFFFFLFFFACSITNGEWRICPRRIVRLPVQISFWPESSQLSIVLTNILYRLMFRYHYFQSEIHRAKATGDGD